MTIAGLKLMVPTSVTATGVGSSASVSATGKVTFTTCATVTINGCFTSSYDNYLVVMRHSAATNNETILAQMSAGGTAATGSNYTYQYLDVGSTTVQGARGTSETSMRIGGSHSSAPNGDHVYFYGPYLAQPTATRNINVRNISSAYITDYACTHSLSTSYDGFKMSGILGNISGTLCVYGLAQ
jgi:hypothetical protein